MSRSNRLIGCLSLTVSLLSCPLFIPILSFRARTIHSLLTQISRYITHSVLKQSHSELESPVDIGFSNRNDFAEDKTGKPETSSRLFELVLLFHEQSTLFLLLSDVALRVIVTSACPFNSICCILSLSCPPSPSFSVPRAARHHQLRHCT